MVLVFLKTANIINILTIAIKYDDDLCKVLFSNRSAENYVNEKYCVECDVLLTSICSAIKKTFWSHYKKLKTVNLNKHKFQKKFDDGRIYLHFTL